MLYIFQCSGGFVVNLLYMTDFKVSHFETVWDDVGHREILCLAILATLISVTDQMSVA